MPTAPKAPQDRRPPAKKATASSKARQQKADDDALDVGFAITDDDGTRLSIRLRDIRGDQEAALVKETGYDFYGLLEAMDRRKGTDLLAIAVWFLRFIHGRNTKTYAETLTETGYADYVERDLDLAKDDEQGPKALDGN